MCSPATLIAIFAFYTVSFLILGSAYIAGVMEIQEVILELKPNINCGETVSSDYETGVRGSIARSCTTTGTGTAKMIEELTFTVEEEMEGPLFLYYEMSGLYQAHRGLVRGLENPMSAKQARTGSCMAYQKPRTDCVAEPNAVFLMGAESWESAVYALWYPKTLASDRTGCYLWWSTRSQQCLKDGDPDSAACTSGPTGAWPPTPGVDNKVHYPCGLAARMVSEGGGLDTLTLVDVAAGSVLGQAQGGPRSKPEEISFDADYSYMKRNLDPEAVFEKSKDQLEDYDGIPAGMVDGLVSKPYYQVLDMHLLRRFPPEVCADDPLGLQPLTILADARTPACTGYKDFSFDAASNGATCTYDMTTPVADPVSGNAITCATKKPNPAGWGIENAHWLNWQRISGYYDFRKLHAKFDVPKVAAGTTLKLVYAHRMDLNAQAGSGHDIRKRVVLQSGNWVGSKNVGVAAAFLVVAGVSMIVLFLLAWTWLKDPERLDRVVYLEWVDFRSRSAAAAPVAA
eukprot:g866.t1